VFLGVEARNRQVARPVRRVERDPSAVWDAGAWWAGIPAVRTVLDAGLDLPAGVTFLVGENGSGKSTLIEALAQAYGLNPEGGSRGAMHRTRPTESPLGAALRLVSFTSTLSLMARLATLAEAGAQIVVATHSPVLTALPAASVLELGEHGIRTTAWSELAVVDHFRAFLDQPDRYLRHLLH
jgi:predicted ATPase